MSATRHPQTSLPGWTVITTSDQLRDHDPHDPAYLLIPPSLVPGVYTLVSAMSEPNDLGECLRGIELFLVGLGECQEGESGGSQLMLDGLTQSIAGLARIMAMASEMSDVIEGEDES